MEIHTLSAMDEQSCVGQPLGEKNLGSKKANAEQRLGQKMRPFSAPKKRPKRVKVHSSIECGGAAYSIEQSGAAYNVELGNAAPSV